MNQRTKGIKKAKRVSLFARVICALAAGGAFAYLAWEPRIASDGGNATSPAHRESELVAGQIEEESGD